MEIGVAWEQPSPSRHGYDWEAIARALREHPGEWLKVFEGGPTSVVNGIRNGNVRQLRREDGFEITTRNNRPATPDDVKTCDLYLRYVKGES